MEISKHLLCLTSCSTATNLAIICEVWTSSFEAFPGNEKLLSEFRADSRNKQEWAKRAASCMFKEAFVNFRYRKEGFVWILHEEDLELRLGGQLWIWWKFHGLAKKSVCTVLRMGSQRMELQYAVENTLYIGGIAPSKEWLGETNWILVQMHAFLSLSTFCGLINNLWLKLQKQRANRFRFCVWGGL